MAVRIKFDNNHNAIHPTLVLAKRSGKKLGSIPSSRLVFKDGMNVCSEISFTVNKEDCESRKHLGDKFWKQITDFKLVWIPEWNKWYEIYVSTEETNDTLKNVTAKELGVAELSQINLYGIEINTEDDIARDDYIPTVLYSDYKPSGSLLTRIIEKAPHYKINHVDESIKNIQRTFTFDGKSIYDSFQEIAEEVDCLFEIDCTSDSDGNIVREINVYDLESYCPVCGERGEFSDKCDKCGNKDIKTGYGKDTSILISTNNLAENINYTTDNESVKNCFKLETGDDLMTATVISCNPNGSAYIWYISDKLKEDMSPELVDRIERYDETYGFYQKAYPVEIPSEMISRYNDIVDKYKPYSKKLSNIPNEIFGYPSLMEVYYNTIDLNLYLSHELMPNVEMQDTNANKEILKLTTDNLSPVAVKNLESCSVSTADSAVLSAAKIVVDERYRVKIKESNFENNVWSGVFVVTNYSDEEDTATSDTISCEINADYEKFIKQKIEKLLKKSSTDNKIAGISDIFKLEEEEFVKELKKYSLSILKVFYDSCQVCIDVMIEQGISNSETEQKVSEENKSLYDIFYKPYYNKLGLIEDEIKIRDGEIAVITGTYDNDGELISDGIQTIIESEQTKIQDKLDFERYLDTDLWREFSSFRREDTYKNDNYVSDGLNNAELFKNALEFVDVANKDIFKSATLQHSITATLKNLLVMKEFEHILDMFEAGNWIRIRTDDSLYKLRLIDYQIDFENLNTLTVTFSDVKYVANGISDIESILSKAASMATSYSSVSRQSKQGLKSKLKMDEWASSGFFLDKIKIVSDAKNQNVSYDNSGLHCKEFLPDENTYDDKQLRLINRGLYLTDDNWRTSKACIGDYKYINPETNQLESSYGIVAETIVGRIMLSEKVGIFNENNSITLDKNGLNITVDADNPEETRDAISVSRKWRGINGEEYLRRVMYVDSFGNLVLSGSIKIETERDAVTLDEVSNLEANKQNAVSDVESIMIGSNKNGLLYQELASLKGIVNKYTDDSIKQHDTKIKRYYNYNDTAVIISHDGGDAKILIANNDIQITSGDKIIARSTNDIFSVPDLTVDTSLYIPSGTSVNVDDSYVSLVDYIKGVVSGKYT